MKKIILKPQKPPSRTHSSTTRKTHSYMESEAKQTEESGGGKKWVIIIAFVIIVVISLATSSSSSRSASPQYGPAQQVNQRPSKPEEKLWMGDWMKKTGAISNEALRARQERVHGNR